MLIGVCGKAGSGKDTVADYLVKEYAFKKISLADPIKRLVKDVFVLDDHTVFDRVAREQPLEQWGGWTVRKLLQNIGTELFRKNIDDGIWVKSLWYRVKDDPTSNYVVPDIRFPNEMEYLASNCIEFFSIKTVRDGCDGSVGQKGHESESYDLETDYVMINNGSYDSLYKAIESALEKEKANKILDEAINKVVDARLKVVSLSFDEV